MCAFSFKADGSAKGKLEGLNIGFLHFSEVKNDKTNDLADTSVNAACEAVKKKYADVSTVSEDAVVKASRALYYKIHLDPTKNRPSGEALLRRVVKGKGIYRISCVVDINNIISLLSGFPCGVYDAQKLHGTEIIVLVGGEGLTYPGLGGRSISGENRILTADAYSVFGGPTADSERTAVTLDTKGVLMLIYSPPGIELPILRSSMEKASLLMQKATGAKEISRGIFTVE